MKRLLLSTFIFLGTIGAAFSYPTSATPLDLSYCMTPKDTVDNIKSKYPDATYIDYTTVMYFTTQQEPTVLAIYFSDLGCADAYEFIPRSTA